MFNWTKNVIISLILVGLLLTGCQNETEDYSHLIHSESETITPHSIGNSVNSVTPFFVLDENPIDVIYVQTEESPYIQIDGLKDLKIQKKINEDLMTLFNKMKRIAKFEEKLPYMGYEVRFNEDTYRSKTYYGINETFNHNNLLGISAYANLNKPSVNLSDSLFHRESLVIDLSSGKPVALSQLFPDNFDWKTQLNAHVKNHLSTIGAEDDASSITLTAPFKGIEDTFNYTLSPYSIELLFDYRHTEFYTKRGTIGITHQLYPLLSNLAFKDRFKTDDTLFKKPIKSKIFITNGFLGPTSTTESEDENGVLWSITTFETDAPAEVIQIFKEKTKTLHEALEQRIKTDSDISALYIYTSITQTGPYYNCSYTVNQNGGETSSFSEVVYLYDHKGNPITVDQIFTDTFDHYAFVKKHLETQLRAQSITLSADTLDTLVSTISVSIQSGGLHFITEPYKFDASMHHPISFYVDYKDIGIENLTLF